jgi:hypothetical protein
MRFFVGMPLLLGGLEPKIDLRARSECPMATSGFILSHLDQRWRKSIGWKLRFFHGNVPITLDFEIFAILRNSWGPKQQFQQSEFFRS